MRGGAGRPTTGRAHSSFDYRLNLEEIHSHSFIGQ